MSTSRPTTFGAYPWARDTFTAVLYGTGYIPQTLPLSLSDTLASADSNVFQAAKVLYDFLVLKEWTSVRVYKSITWINPSANANVFDTLYGKYKYGTVLFGGLKPLATWSRGPIGRQPSVWTNANGHKYNS